MSKSKTYKVVVTFVDGPEITSHFDTLEQAQGTFEANQKTFTKPEYAKLLKSQKLVLPQD
jgi:hypothetical protein